MGLTSFDLEVGVDKRSSQTVRATSFVFQPLSAGTRQTLHYTRMARSVSRSRKVSKSPGRRKMASPKSEPKHSKVQVKTPSRARSASRGRDKAKSKKSPKSISRSQSRGRQIKKRLSKSPVKKRMLSPVKTPKSPSRKPSVKRTPSMKTPVSKTPSKIPAPKPSVMKTPLLDFEAIKIPAPKPTPAPVKTPVFSSISSEFRPSRSFERKTYNSTPMEEPLMRQRYLRHESSSPTPVKITPRKQFSEPSAVSQMYNNACGSVSCAGRVVRNNFHAAYRTLLRNRREIFVTIILLAMILALTYFIFYTDPAKTRAFIHSIPIKVQAWYRKHMARK